MMSSHRKFINLAHNIAKKNFGKTFPNPTVGCIISKNNKIISKGVTSATGRPHAEEIALKKAGIKAKGATTMIDKIGLYWAPVKNQKAPKEPATNTSPLARFMILATPYCSCKPIAINAYAPPSNTPIIRISI